MVKERIRYIDILESIAILLVIYCHYTLTIGESALANITLQFTTTVAVPLFFMANGVLLFNSKLDVKKHYIKTLLLLFATLFWKALYLLFVIVGRGFEFTLYSARSLFVFFGPSSFADPYIPAAHFWFMYALIAIYLLYPIFKVLYDKGLMWILGIFIALIIVVVYRYEICGYTSMPVYVEYTSYLLFFLIGPFIHKACYKKEYGYKSIVFAVFSIAAFAVLIYQRYKYFGILEGPWQRLPLDYQRMATLIMAVSIYAFFASIDFKETKVTRYFEFISVRTMNIYVIHGLLGYIFEVYITPMLPYNDVLIHLGRSILILGLSILILEPISYISVISTLLGIRKQSLKTKEKV